MPLLAASAFILVLIFYGLAKRHNRKVHIPAMATAFALDVLLVLIVELTRHAIEKAIGHTDASPLLIVHITASLLTLVFYVVLTTSGIKLNKGDESRRESHRKYAYVFLVARVTNFVTSFWVGGLFG